MKPCSLFVALAYSLGSWSYGAESKPNIILCMADDQGWGDVGYNGHKVLKTPTLDAMAASGMRFDRFYAAAPVCSPTRGSVLTRRHPNRFGCFSWGYPGPGRPVKSDEILAELARRQAGESGSIQSGVAQDDDASVTEKYSEAVLPGHAAWLDNQYKLHRIADKGGQAKYVLFDLSQDPQEKHDLAETRPQRLDQMKSGLEVWQKSVVRSLNGGDYMNPSAPTRR